MVNQKDVEEIKKLIQKGFKLELIALEFNIPIEQVRQWQGEIEGSTKSKGTRVKDIIKKKNEQAHLRVAKMKEKYRKLYLKTNKVENVRTKKLSPQELEIVRKVIRDIQEELESNQNSTRKQKVEMASRITKKLKTIEGFQLPLEEAEQLYDMLCSKGMKLLNVSAEINQSFRRNKRTIANQFLTAVEDECYDIDDIQELQKLNKKITIDMIKEHRISAYSAQSKISSKIATIKQKQQLDKIRNDIPANIRAIIEDLASGDLDVQGANVVIDEEARKRAESRPQNKFRLSEKQERNQILIQIKVAIETKTDCFHIQHPEKTISLMQELCGGRLDQSIGPVVRNFIARKDFDTARKICIKFSSQDEDDKQIPAIQLSCVRNLMNEIRNAEIGNMVKTLLSTEQSAEKERMCLELLEEGFKMGNVKLSAISLGKSKDGTTNITLADIWKIEHEKVGSR